MLVTGLEGDLEGGIEGVSRGSRGGLEESVINSITGI
jgi:hypothetical protein